MTAPPIIVLVESQDFVNVASAVRIAKNFGIDYLRLVNPVAFDAYRIEGIAHNTGDIVAKARIFDSLAEATADCIYMIALTARERAAKRVLLRPRIAAEEITARSAEGPVALVFGREDSGLTNSELDHCHALAGIATNPVHRSLNLAQAVAIMGYECWNAREGIDQSRKPPRRQATGARVEDLANLFQDLERSLWAIDFFKSRKPENVMRSFREMFFRADLDTREARLLRALGLETVNYLHRAGVLQELPPAFRDPAGKRVPSEPAEEP